MKKRKGLSSDVRGGAEDDDMITKILDGKLRKKQMRVVSKNGLRKDGVETKKSKVMRTDDAEQDISAKVKKIKTTTKKKMGEVAAEDDVLAASKKSEQKRKRKRTNGIELDDGAEKAKSMLKKRKKKKHKTVGQDTAEDDSLEEENGNLDVEEDDISEKPSIPSAMSFAKYIPPHLREVEKGSEERIRLERRVRGLLNRLTEGNVESITSDVSTIFQAHGRRLVTEIISNEIVGACREGPRGNDQYAAVFAAYVAGMSAMSGIDFGANFVAALAISFEVKLWSYLFERLAQKSNMLEYGHGEDLYQKGDSIALRNLALLLSHLYNFHLLPSEVLYQVLDVLCKRFEELDVATILTILQSCGMGLRGDDPSAMKDFVLSIQKRTSEARAALVNKGDLSKRVQFMLETICEIKNNKRQTKEVPTHSRLKKWLQKIGVDNVQLRAVTWKSLIDPVKKGQWWLPSVGNTEDRADDKGEIAGAMDAGIAEADKMLQLAASQRMNTDSRKAVFCMVMSGGDYIDAFEKLLRMKLPGTQDREILRVIVECCLQEKLFNKYYALLAAKLCDYDKNHKFTVQYCLWDHFKQLDTMELRRSANLARFLAHMVGSYSLSLAVLKPIDFTDPTVMTAKVVMHFRIFLDTLLSVYSDEVIWNCFSRVAAPPNLATLRDGLALFLHQHTKQPVGGNHADKEVKGILASRYRLAKKGLANIAGIGLQ